MVGQGVNDLVNAAAGGDRPPSPPAETGFVRARVRACVERARAFVFLFVCLSVVLGKGVGWLVGLGACVCWHALIHAYVCVVLCLKIDLESRRSKIENRTMCFSFIPDPHTHTHTCVRATMSAAWYMDYLSAGTLPLSIRCTACQRSWCRRTAFAFRLARRWRSTTSGTCGRKPVKTGYVRRVCVGVCVPACTPAMSVTLVGAVLCSCAGGGGEDGGGGGSAGGRTDHKRIRRG